jgi:uncharacterized protein
MEGESVMRWMFLMVFSLLAALPAVAGGYDAALAKRLVADQYGMKSYVLVILKTGPKGDLSKEERAKVFQGHMANIKRLAEQGKLVVAGPFDENADHLEGIFIFNAAKVEDAVALLKTDPAVAAGVLAYEAYGWYGSAALQETAAIHKRIAKSSP